MSDASAALARSITRASSTQTYYTIRLLADRDLVDDCHRAYAYFRWADDMVDVSCGSTDERVSFIAQQRRLIDRLYTGERPDRLTPQEEIVADLIGHDEEESSGLKSFIYNFLAVIEFDAHRKGRLISQEELTWYSNTLGKAVTDCVLHFVGHGHPYPDTDRRFLGPVGAHIAHMLRDMLLDASVGFVNIPREYLKAHDIQPQDVSSEPYRAWVRGRVEQARQYFREGERFFDQLALLRRKIVGYWYCARFEGLLNAIERDGYVLRAAYDERRRLSSLLRFAWLPVSVSSRHLSRRFGSWSTGSAR
jgi:phytoene/squalene synthetase